MDTDGRRDRRQQQRAQDHAGHGRRRPLRQPAQQQQRHRRPRRPPRGRPPSRRPPRPHRQQRRSAQQRGLHLQTRDGRQPVIIVHRAIRPRQLVAQIQQPARQKDQQQRRPRPAQHVAPATLAPRRRGEQQAGRREQHPAIAGRIRHQHQPERVEEAQVRRPARQHLHRKQGPRQRQHLPAHVLHGALVQHRRCRLRRMIQPRPADEGEVEPGIARAPRRGEVGRIGQMLVDEHTQRRADRARHGIPEQPHHAAIVGPGLEHRCPAAAATRLHVDDDAGPARQRIGGEERGRALQPCLLAIGQQDDQITRRLPLGQHGADRFQRRRDAGTIIRGSGRSEHAVIMRHQQDRRARAIAPGQRRHHVDDLRPHDRHPGPGGDPFGRGRAHRRAARPDRQAHAVQPLHQITAYAGILRTSGRMRRPRDRAHIRHRAPGRKHLFRCTRRARPRRRRPDHRQQHRARQRHDHRPCLAHRPPRFGTKLAQTATQRKPGPQSQPTAGTCRAKRSTVTCQSLSVSRRNASAGRRRTDPRRRADTALRQKIPEIARTPDPASAPLGPQIPDSLV